MAPPAVPTWDELSAAVDSETEKATKGDESPADAVSAMQKQAESIGTGL
jgi:multiple sugar transport system substrate-binding protein